MPKVLTPTSHGFIIGHITPEAADGGSTKATSGVLANDIRLVRR